MATTSARFRVFQTLFALTALTALWLAAGALRTASAADLALADDDCKTILERWAKDPDSVPKRLVDNCKEQVGAAAPEAPPPVQPMAATDPCSGPNAANSVFCWGPWSQLAPAAGPIATAALLPIDEFRPRPELAGEFTPDVDPELPLGSCAPGTPCGFATIVDGITTIDDPEDTAFGRIALAPNGSQFSITREATGTINSVTGMTTTVTPRSDGYENMRSDGVAETSESQFVARVLRGEGNAILQASGNWRNVNTPSGPNNSGYFAWGTAATQNVLDTLNAGNVTATFNGTMSVDRNTLASITIDFGSNPTWTGSWTNPGYNFSAGGGVRGADFISNPNQFSSNVQAGFVQGAIVGAPGSAPGPGGVVHIIDVTLNDVGRLKDVGLLREVVPQ